MCVVGLWQVSRARRAEALQQATATSDSEPAGGEHGGEVPEPQPEGGGVLAANRSASRPGTV